MPQYARVSNESNPSKSRGCFFYGCLSLVVIGLLVIVASVIGYFALKRTADRWVNEYTETTPTLVEQLEYPKAQMDALNRRLASFKDALDKGQASTELILSADDLNALIATSREWRGKVFVRIDDDKIQGDVSVPLNDMGPLKLKGRYLNGTAIFKVALDQGVPEVRVEDVQVKGKPLPSILLTELKKDNLLRNIRTDPEMEKTMAKFESVQVTNSQVIVRNRVSNEK